jgi:3-dehydroquinate dehydratase
MNQKENIFNQHAENTDWMNRLDFYKTEIQILKNLLGEVAEKNTAEDVQKQVEHYENQFMVQRNNIDLLAHNIQLNEDKLQKEIVSNPVAVDHRKMAYHQTEKEFIDFFETNFNEVRHDFKVFAAKWM